jgi:hypothetical protein
MFGTDLEVLEVIFVYSLLPLCDYLFSRGNFPIRILVEISQADAALTIMVFTGFSISERTASLSSLSADHHHRRQ